MCEPGQRIFISATPCDFSFLLHPISKQISSRVGEIEREPCAFVLCRLSCHSDKMYNSSSTNVQLQTAFYCNMTFWRRNPASNKDYSSVRVVCYRTVIHITHQKLVLEWIKQANINNLEIIQPILKSQVGEKTPLQINSTISNVMGNQISNQKLAHIYRKPVFLCKLIQKYWIH